MFSLSYKGARKKAEENVLLVVWLVQEPKMSDGDADLGVVLDVLHEEVGIRLSPVARAAGMPSCPAQIPEDEFS